MILRYGLWQAGGVGLGVKSLAFQFMISDVISKWFRFHSPYGLLSQGAQWSPLAPCEGQVESSMELVQPYGGEKPSVLL